MQIVGGYFTILYHAGQRGLARGGGGKDVGAYEGSLIDHFVVCPTAAQQPITLAAVVRWARLRNHRIKKLSFFGLTEGVHVSAEQFIGEGRWLGGE